MGIKLTSMAWMLSVVETVKQEREYGVGCSGSLGESVLGYAKRNAISNREGEGVLSHSPCSGQTGLRGSALSIHCPLGMTAAKGRRVQRGVTWMEKGQVAVLSRWLSFKLP